MRGDTKNRTQVLIGIGLLGLSGLLALFFMSLLSNGQPVAAEGKSLPVMTSVPPTATPQLVELWDAYEQALAAAQAEAADAQLVSASARWDGATERALVAGAEGWACTFYSAAGERLLDVVVSADEAWVVNRTPVSSAPALLTGTRWQAGPRDALLIFLAHGAREFLEQHPQVLVQLSLSQHEDGYPVWNGAAVDAGARDTFGLLVNAETMQMMFKSP